MKIVAFISLALLFTGCQKAIEETKVIENVLHDVEEAETALQQEISQPLVPEEKPVQATEREDCSAVCM